MGGVTMRHLFALGLCALGCGTDKVFLDTGDVGEVISDPGEAVSDNDRDGSPSDEDCDDEDASVYPDAEEICDGVDNDCDGEVDEGLLTEVYEDADGDGFGDPAAASEACIPASGQVDNGSDCDDSDPAIHPGVEDICDGLDNDCDGEVDEDADGITWYLDEDGDGYGDSEIAITNCTGEAPAGYAPIYAPCIAQVDGSCVPASSTEPLPTAAKQEALQLATANAPAAPATLYAGTSALSPSRAASTGDELVPAAVLLLHEVFRAVDEVGEGVLLVHELPVFVPGAAVFLAAADMGERVDEAAIQQAEQAAAETGMGAAAVGAVGIEEERGAAVFHEPFAINERDGNLVAIPRGGVEALGEVVLPVKPPEDGSLLEQGLLPGAHVVVEHTSRGAE